MNADPVPPVRWLLTHVIPAEPVRREAGVRHGGEARQVGTRAASLQLVMDLTVWSEMLLEDISRVTIFARAQGHESSCNDSTRICIILLTTQVAGQIL